MGQPRVEVLEAVLLALTAGRLARRGDWERVLQVAETIPEGDDRTSAPEDLATAFGKPGVSGYWPSRK